VEKLRKVCPWVEPLVEFNESGIFVFFQVFQVSLADPHEAHKMHDSLKKTEVARTAPEKCQRVGTKWTTNDDELIGSSG
jgi:hypothetical protein